MTDFEIAISTVDRTPQYIHTTLESLHASDPAARNHRIRLVVCGSGVDYLGSWLGQPHIKAEPLSEPEWASWARIPGEGRILLNFRRVIGDGTGPLLALQDDLTFAQNWIEELGDAIDHHQERRRQHPTRHADRFVIALYAPYKMKLRPLSNYNPHRFYGNQALWFSGAARIAMAQAIDKALADRAPQPDDMVVKHAAQRRSFDLFMLNPNVVQHIGKSSSLSLRFHKSPTFKP